MTEPSVETAEGRIEIRRRGGGASYIREALDALDARDAALAEARQHGDAIQKAADYTLRRNMQIANAALAEAYRREDDLALKLQVADAAVHNARAAERERCAKVAEKQLFYPDTHTGTRQAWVKAQIAAAIRALKDPAYPISGPAEGRDDG